MIFQWFLQVSFKKIGKTVIFQCFLTFSIEKITKTVIYHRFRKQWYAKVAETLVYHSLSLIYELELPAEASIVAKCIEKLGEL